MTEKPAVYNPHFQGSETPVTDSRIFYVNPDMKESLTEFNPIIIFGGTVGSISNKPEKVAEATKREREIFSALESGSVVCITFYIDSLVFRILRRIGIEYGTWEEPRVDFTAKRSEFLSFLKNFGSAQYSFSDDFDDIICQTDEGHVVGFAEKVGNGVLLFLPCYALFKQFSELDFLKKFLTSLLSALRVYGPKIQYAPPNWVNTYRFPKEATFVSKIEEIKKELNKSKSYLERYLRLKEVLWFRDDELVDSVTNFFNEIGIGTKKDEIYEEDFWIMEQNKESVIVEVKGLDKNLKRPHISQLDEHRGAREKPDDFPALLVVNSFNKAGSLKEKDKPISANEVKKAVRTNVLILRTIDLCNAYYLMEREKLDPMALLKVIEKENGWLRITESAYEIKKE